MARGSRRPREAPGVVKKEEVILDYHVMVGRGNGQRAEAVMGLDLDREEKVEVSF